MTEFVILSAQELQRKEKIKDLQDRIDWYEANENWYYYFKTKAELQKIRELPEE